MNLYGINYKVCNIGSTYNTDNSETCKMPQEGRFKYSSGGYTAIPCYANPDNTAYSPSVNSSGRCTSIYSSSWYYYPAISTYVKFYYKIND